MWLSYSQSRLVVLFDISENKVREKREEIEQREGDTRNFCHCSCYWIQHKLNTRTKRGNSMFRNGLVESMVIHCLYQDKPR